MKGRCVSVSVSRIILAAVSIFSGMKLMYWSDGCLGRRNRFYSIRVCCVRCRLVRAKEGVELGRGGGFQVGVAHVK